MWQHEIVNTSCVLLLHWRRVDQMTQVLVHHLRYERREGSLSRRNTSLVREHTTHMTLRTQRSAHKAKINTFALKHLSAPAVTEQRGFMKIHSESVRRKMEHWLPHTPLIYQKEPAFATNINACRATRDQDFQSRVKFKAF